MSSTVSPAGRNWTLIAAFAIVYVIWGSTYLAIGYAIDTIPPLLMASVRFLIAGGALYAMARWRGAAPPLRIHWRSTLIIGALLFLGGNGGVTWSEQFVPTGLASLVVAIVPVWVVLLEWLLPNGRRPTMPVIIGVLVGLAGMALLVSSNGSSGSTQQFTVPGLLVLMASTFCWASGSIYATKAPLPSASMLTTGMEMLCGGAWLMLLGTVTGEWENFHPAQISATSLFAVLYLIVFGAMLAFSAYIYVLNHTSPARAATYAYVNPVVAVFLGWLFRDEPLTLRTIVAAAVIVSAVVIITTYRAGRTTVPPANPSMTAAEGQQA